MQWGNVARKVVMLATCVAIVVTVAWGASTSPGTETQREALPYEEWESRCAEVEEWIYGPEQILERLDDPDYPPGSLSRTWLKAELYAVTQELVPASEREYRVPADRVGAIRALCDSVLLVPDFRPEMLTPSERIHVMRLLVLRAAYWDEGSEADARVAELLKRLEGDNALGWYVAARNSHKAGNAEGARREFDEAQKKADLTFHIHHVSYALLDLARQAGLPQGQAAFLILGRSPHPATRVLADVRDMMEVFSRTEEEAWKRRFVMGSQLYKNTRDDPLYTFGFLWASGAAWQLSQIAGPDQEKWRRQAEKMRPDRREWEQMVRQWQQELTMIRADMRVPTYPWRRLGEETLARKGDTLAAFRVVMEELAPGLRGHTEKGKE